MTTLKASGDRLGGMLAYYAGLAEDRERAGPGRGPVDYYLDPDEPPGRWWGKGRRSLGLEGPVIGSALRSVLDGRHPDGDIRLGRRFGDTSARGFDATFSAPKSVSVLWALTPDPWVRAEVLAAHDSAVDAALGWFERHGAVTRRGRDGIHQVDSRGVVVAVFRQHTSRSMDPQLHTHAVISSKVQDGTGTWLALDARFLKYQQRSIGAVYDAALRAELSGRLGVGWVKNDKDVWDLHSVPQPVCAAFSKRSAQVETKLAELVRSWTAGHDGAEPDPRTIANLQRTAALVSRPDKSHRVDAEALRRAWAEEARHVGFDPARLGAEKIAEREPALGLISDDDDLVEAALVHASEEASSWLRADLARHIASILAPGSTPDAEVLVAEVDRLSSIAASRCLPLGPDYGGTTRESDRRPVSEHVTDRRLTTRSVLRQEGDLQAWAEQSTRPVAIADDAQDAASRGMAGYDDLVLVIGPAGTGKTRSTARAVALIDQHHRNVVGLAPSGKAADVLATAARCPTDTVAGFLTRHSHRASQWPPGTTVVLDEAGMVATDDLVNLVELVRLNQWRLVAVGDPNQLPSVARGGVFAHWCDTLPHHLLEEPRRFTHRWEAAASLALRNGRLEATETYAANGRLHSAHPALVARQVAHAFASHERHGRSVAITVTNNDTAKAINQEIQSLRGRDPRRGVALADGTLAHVGDEVATRLNHGDLRTSTGHRVRNRHTWTVSAAHTDGGLTVDHPTRGSVELPAAYVASHLELGWAVTGYGTQGDTVDVGIAVLDATATRNHAYVAMTRGRHANHAVLLDAQGLDDPAEQLAQIIGRPSNGESALAIQSRLHHAAGVELPSRMMTALTHGSSGHRGPPSGPLSRSQSNRDRDFELLEQQLDRLQQPRDTGTQDHSLGL